MKEKTIERISVEAPPIIKELFEFPYYWIFKKKFKGSFLDVGCGELNLSNKLFSAIGTDIAGGLKTLYVQADARDLPFANKSFDYVFCFETIEHIHEQERVISELERVARKAFFVGTVNKTGPSFIKGIEIYKGERNIYHVKELSWEEFPRLFKKFKNKEFYHSLYNGKRFRMKQGLTKFGYCNYAIVKVA